MRVLCAWIFIGAVVLLWNPAWGDVVVSTGPLTPPATDAVLLPPEPYELPLGSVEAGVVSGFGRREALAVSSPTAAGETAKTEAHEGIDYGAPPGTIVRAARSGKVIFAGFSKMYTGRADKKDQARLVIILHADGQSSRYVHLSGLRVRPGQEVKAGQPLAAVAESDEWTVPVLHFEIRTAQGKAVDPEAIFEEQVAAAAAAASVPIPADPADETVAP